MKLLTRVGAVALVAAGIIGGAAPAHAEDGAALEDAKRVVTAQIDGRIAALNAGKKALDAAVRVTPPHRETLGKLLVDDIAGLTALRGKVAGETTLAAVRVDAQIMVNEYRVYLLVGPKVRLTIAGDVGSAAVPALQKVYDRLAAAVEKAKQAGKDVGNSDALLADMKAQLGTASGAIDGQVDALLAIQAGPDGEAIRGQLTPIRESLGTARTSLRKAVKDAREVRAILKGLA